jgi:HAD superfamily hydrolase (TIGR01548 family)
LAGLRVGYALAAPSIIANLRAAGNPYSISAPSLRLAEEVVRNWPADSSGYVATARAERRVLEELAGELGLAPIPSQANFVCCDTDRAAWLHGALASQGIAIRHFAHRPGLERLIRMSCPGEAAGLERLTTGLRTALEPEAILFDMDGVLADVSTSYHEAIIGAARSWGVSLDGPTVRAAKQEPGANNDWEVTRRLVCREGRDITFEEARKRFEELYQGTDHKAGLWQSETLIPGRETLARLAQRLPLAIVTGRPRGDAERFLKMTETADYFQSLICMEDAPLKPDPAPVRLALQRLGVSRAWMVGDTPDDLVAARQAGVVPLGFLPAGAGEESRSRLRTAGAARVLTNSDQLMELLP